MLINSESTFRDVNKVTMSYLLVKNFDSKSLIAIDAKQTQQFTVKKIKFNQTDNLIFANRYLEFRRPHCFYSILMHQCSRQVSEWRGGGELWRGAGRDGGRGPQVSCDWSIRGHVIRCSPLIGHSMLVMMGLILAITAAAILVIFYKDGFKGSQ